MKGNERKRKEMKGHERKMLGNVLRKQHSTRAFVPPNHRTWHNERAPNRIQRESYMKGNGTEKKNNYEVIEVIKELKGTYKAGYTT